MTAKGFKGVHDLLQLKRVRADLFGDSRAG